MSYFPASFTLLLRTGIFIISLTSLMSCAEIQPLDIGNIDDMQVKSLNEKGVEMILGVTIKNPNNMKFKVKAYDLDVYLEEKKMGKAKLVNKVIIPKKSDQHYDLPVDVKFTGLLLGGLPILAKLKTKKNIDVRIKGNVKVRARMVGKTFPVDIKQRVPLSGFAN